MKEVILGQAACGRNLAYKYAINSRGLEFLAYYNPPDGGWTMGEIQFSIKEIRTENLRVYYRVFADGVEFPSIVYIFASEKNRDSDEELKVWCKKNASRLDTGMIVRAELVRLEKKKGHGA